MYMIENSNARYTTVLYHASCNKLGGFGQSPRSVKRKWGYSAVDRSPIGRHILVGIILSVLNASNRLNAKKGESRVANRLAVNIMLNDY